MMKTMTTMAQNHPTTLDDDGFHKVDDGKDETRDDWKHDLDNDADDDAHDLAKKKIPEPFNDLGLGAAVQDLSEDLHPELKKISSAAADMQNHAIALAKATNFGEADSNDDDSEEGLLEDKNLQHDKAVTDALDKWRTATKSTSNDNPVDKFTADLESASRGAKEAYERAVAADAQIAAITKEHAEVA